MTKTDRIATYVGCFLIGVIVGMAVLNKYYVENKVIMSILREVSSEELERATDKVIEYRRLKERMNKIYEEMDE